TRVSRRPGRTARARGRSRWPHRSRRGVLRTVHGDRRLESWALALGGSPIVGVVLAEVGERAPQPLAQLDLGPPAKLVLDQRVVGEVVADVDALAVRRGPGEAVNTTTREP